MSSSEPDLNSSANSSDSCASESSRSSSELDSRKLRKKRRVLYQPERSDEQPQVSRHTLRRWEQQGILVPEPSTGTRNSTSDDGSGQNLLSGENSPPQDVLNDSQSSEELSSVSSESVARLHAASSESGDTYDSASDSDSASSSGSLETQNSSKKLFPTSPKTTEQAVLMLLELYQKHKWSKSSLKGTLKMIVSLLPEPNSMPKSLYLLFKFVDETAPVNTPETVNFYCAKCHYFIGTQRKNCAVCDSSDLHHFYTFSIRDQVKFLFENRNLAELLDKYNVSQHVKEGVYSDICSGSEYQRVKVSGEYAITLLWNTDGVSKFGGSSESQFWPVQYVICELPFHLRKLFLVVCGVWFDESKPPMNTLLRPFVESLREIQDEGGVSWTHPVSGEAHQSMVLAPGFCGDAPARADVQNLEQHMSNCGCNLCEQQRQQISAKEAEERGMKKRRSFFTYQNEPSQLRTNDGMNQQGLQAARNKRIGEKPYSIKGVKGPAVVALLPSLDRSAFVYPEYMHSTCLGVVLQFINILFFSPNSNEFWTVSNYTDLIDCFLLDIKPTDYTRVPREISKVPRKKWRAHEYRAWLLFFSLPALVTWLNRDCLQHWILLVTTVNTLLKEEITHADIDKSDALLRSFVKGIKKLYGTPAYSYNVHQLLHLPLVVKRWGPLWANSAFLFENSNGILSSLIHGPNKKAKELVNNLKIGQSMHVLKSRVKERTSSSKNSCHLSKEVKLDSDVSQCLIDVSKDIIRPKFFSHAVINDVTVTSKLYVLETKRNNFTVSFQGPQGKEYGEIECFVLDGQNKTEYAILRSFKVVHTNLFCHEETRTIVSHIIPVKPTGTLSLVQVDSVKEKVIRVGNYVCHVPNKYEKIL